MSDAYPTDLAAHTAHVARAATGVGAAQDAHFLELLDRVARQRGNTAEPRSGSCDEPLRAGSVNICDLYFLIQSFGGFSVVEKRRQWPMICTHLKLDRRLALELRGVYLKRLFVLDAMFQQSRLKKTGSTSDDECDSDSESDGDQHLFEFGSVWQCSNAAKRACIDVMAPANKRARRSTSSDEHTSVFAGATTSDDADETSCSSATDSTTNAQNQTPLCVIYDNNHKPYSNDSNTINNKDTKDDDNNGFAARKRQSSVPPLLQSTCGSFGGAEDDERVVEKFLMTLSQHRKTHCID